MLKDKKFILAIVASMFIIVVIGVFRPSEINWRPTFLSSDKIPYGTYILYNSLPDIFDTEVTLNNSSIYNLLHDKNFENTSLVFVQGEFAPNATQTDELLNFVAGGNNLFVSAGHIRHRLTDTLRLIEKRSLYNPTALATEVYQDSIAYSQANFTNSKLHSDSGYHFKKDFFYTYYKFNEDTSIHSDATSTDTISTVTVLGTDGSQRANFIRIGYGKGFIYLHSNPYAFTNYYMLSPHGNEYAAKCFSYLAPGHIIWDEYGKREERKEKSPLSFILSVESLRWAYYTGMLFLLLFIIFNIKRRQRIIPVVDPFKNTSLEFTKTIGSLYFNQSNHKNIAHKKITYLFEFIRNKYGIDTALLDEEFARKLSYKSGMHKDAVEHLINIIAGIASKSRISDTELIDLNHAIEYFKNNCQ